MAWQLQRWVLPPVTNPLIAQLEAHDDPDGVTRSPTDEDHQLVSFTPPPAGAEAPAEGRQLGIAPDQRPPTPHGWTL